MVVLQWEVVNIYFVKYNCWYSRGCKSGGHFHLFYHNFIPFYLVGWWSFCFVGTVSYRVINLFFVVPKSDGYSISFEYSSLVRKTCMQVVLPLSASTYRKSIQQGLISNIRLTWMGVDPIAVRSFDPLLYHAWWLETTSVFFLETTSIFFVRCCFIDPINLQREDPSCLFQQLVVPVILENSD